MSVTIYDVAKHAGVSPRTVSNVVNGYPFVSALTRDRVQQSVDALGYRPNAVARSLRKGRTGMIAVAVPEFGVPYFSELCQSVIDELAGRSCTVIMEQTDGDPSKELDLLENRRQASLFDGLIFSPLGLGAEDIASAKRLTPVVLLGERVHGGPFDHVSIDNVGAARTAVEHLLGLGRSRIAAIGEQSDERLQTGQLRTQGYSEALHAAGLPLDPELVVPTAHFHRDEGAEAMSRLLALARPPDAVFCFNDLLAVGAMHTVLHRGLRVPDDVAIVGFDDIEEGRYSTPTLTSISPDKRRIASSAVEQLFRRLEDDGGEPVDVTAPYALEVRESTLGMRRDWQRRPPRSQLSAAAGPATGEETSPPPGVG